MKTYHLLFQLIILEFNLGAALALENGKSYECISSKDCQIKDYASCCGKNLELIKGCFHKDKKLEATKDCSENLVCAKRIGIKSCSCKKGHCISVH